MKLVSERGEFSDFQALRAAYLEAPDAREFWHDPLPLLQGEWEPGRIHASDAGACPRAVMYRLLGTPEKPRSKSSANNRRVMFWAGYALHALTYSALDWAGLLVEAERIVTLPFGISARCDALFRPDYQSADVWLYDCKTVLPNALKYGDMPKEKDCLQLGAYALDPSLPILSAVVEYVDRAGSNSPQMYEVNVDEWNPLAKKRLSLLHEMADAAVTVGLLPETTPAVYSGHYSWDGQRMALDTIDYGPDWRCGYCDYHLTVKEKRKNPNSGRMKEWGWTHKDSTCRPYNLPPLSVAKIANGSVQSVKLGHEEGCEKWLASARKHYVVASDS